ncbi:hypothetical protein LT493_24500 [Streptomyces tricolor]|nr:hypothetical protein [Streptomyces tricolor]
MGCEDRATPRHARRPHRRCVVDRVQPRGSTLTSASWSGGVRQWDSKTGTLRLTNLAHRLPGYRWAVKISPDGATFGMTGNDGVSRADGTTHLWDVTSGRHHASSTAPSPPAA